MVMVIAVYHGRDTSNRRPVVEIQEMDTPQQLDQYRLVRIIVVVGGQDDPEWYYVRRRRIIVILVNAIFVIVIVVLVVVVSLFV